MPRNREASNDPFLEFKAFGILERDFASFCSRQRVARTNEAVAQFAADCTTRREHHLGFSRAEIVTRLAAHLALDAPAAREQTSAA